MASDYLLEIEGIKGESQDSKHKDTIEIDSFSWGMTNTNAGGGRGGGGGAGKVVFQDIHFTKHVDKASPLLMLSCATGEHIKKATLFVRKSGGEQQDYYIVQLEDVLVSEFSSKGDQTAQPGMPASPVPTDQFSLNFSKIEFEVKIQDARGALTGSVKGGWDIKTNKGA